MWTSHYQGQFAPSLGKESPYISSKFNLLNTDTPLIRILSMAPLVSVLTETVLFERAINYLSLAIEDEQEVIF